MADSPLILLGVSGSIAAYKSPAIVRLLRDDGFDVRVAMTPAAAKFVGPLTFEAISGAPVSIDPVAIAAEEKQGPSGIVHTDLTARATALVVAPATADIIGKIAHGLGDDAVSVLALALDASAALVIAPAMNPRMWANPAVQANLRLLRDRGAVIVEPGDGEMACGDTGTGRMKEPDEIAAWVRRAIALRARRGPARRVLILSGPTRERIDDVRFLSNGSSGRMGAALAEAVFESGDDVTVISGPAAVMPPPWIPTRRVTTGAEMLEAARGIACDILISPAAICDYRPVNARAGKPEKSGSFALELESTADVLAALSGEKKQCRIVAFAAEESIEREQKAIEKARGKKADYIVLNDAKATMDAESITCRLIRADSGAAKSIGPVSKKSAAREIWSAIRENQPD